MIAVQCIGTLFVFLCPPTEEIVQWAQTVFSHLNQINGLYLGELKMVSGLVKWLDFICKH